MVVRAVISALGKLRQGEYEFEASLSHIVGFGAVWAAQWDPISNYSNDNKLKKQNKKK